MENTRGSSSHGNGGLAESRLRYGCGELETSPAAHDSPGRLKSSPTSWAVWVALVRHLRQKHLSVIRVLRTASPSSDLHWKPVPQVWLWHPECHSESSRGSQQEHTALHQANGSARERSAPAPCRCAPHRQGEGADSCT